MSKRIGIISDTHDFLREEVVEIACTCDCVFHAGDITGEGILDALRPLTSIYAVRGNNDWGWAQKLSRSLNFTIEGVKFFLVHDKRDAAWNLGDTQVVVFGHSHIYSEEIKDGRLWLNPGSCGRQRFGQEASMAVMTIENGTYQVEKIVLEKERQMKNK